MTKARRLKKGREREKDELCRGFHEIVCAGNVFREAVFARAVSCALDVRYGRKSRMVSHVERKRKG